ncbi:MAG: hypothetical protein D6675_02645 [Gemmatimonadetes bacterium]|nr:MAG: hypothetical protein D6675_02645 [Gemmatimonadota bacterium]
MTQRTFIVLFLIWIGWFPATGEAAFQITAQIGFRGYHKVDEWTPVTVSIQNDEADLEAILRMSATDYNNKETVRYEMPVHLPAGSDKQFQMYMKFEQVSSYIDPNLTCKLNQNIPYQGQLTDQITLKLSQNRRLEYTDYLIVVVGQNDLGLSAISGKLGDGDVRVVTVDPAELPDQWYGYKTADLVILGDISVASFPLAQLEALKKWVIAGGRLLFSGGQYASVFRDPALAPLLPVTIGTLQRLPLTELHLLQTVYQAPFVDSAEFVTVASGTLRPQATARLRLGEYPLLATMPLGQGQTTFLAVDLGAPPLLGWAGTKELVFSLLDVHVQDFGWGSSQQMVQKINKALANISAVEPPSFGFIAFFLILYVLIVGPVNYLVLKRHQKLEWAWVTIPIIVVVFSGGAYLVGYASKGGDLLLKQFTIIAGEANQPEARVQTYFSMFSPKKQRYTIAGVAPSTLIQPFDEPSSSRRGSPDETGLLIYQQSPDQLRIDPVEMSMWSLNRFEAETTLPFGDGIQAIGIRYDGHHLSGTLTNRTPYTFEANYLIFGGNIIALKPFKAGDVLQLNIDENAMQSFDHVLPLPLIYPSTEVSFFEELILLSNEILKTHHSRTLLPNEAPLLEPLQPIWLGLVEEPIPEMAIHPAKHLKQNSGALMFMHLPYQLSGSFTLPPYTTALTVSDYDAAQFHLSSNGILLENGFCEFTVALPQLPDTLTEFKFQTVIAGKNTHPSNLSVYDWHNQEWVPYEVGTGNPNRFFQPQTGMAKLKLDSRQLIGNTLEISDIQITIEGTWE